MPVSLSLSLSFLIILQIFVLYFESDGAWAIDFVFFLSNVRVWYFGLIVGLVVVVPLVRMFTPLGPEMAHASQLPTSACTATTTTTTEKKEEGETGGRENARKRGGGRVRGGGEKNGRHIGLISLAPTITICIKEKRLNI